MLTVRSPISDLVADLRRLRAEAKDEHALLRELRPIARRAALSKDDWVEQRMYHADPEQGFGVYLLHEEPDHTLAVFAISWLPDHGTPPHDHGTWGVVAGVDGPERNEFFRRTDDGSRAGYAELHKIGEKIFAPGDVLAMPSGSIHRVWNASDRVTLSLHIYGRHLNHAERSQFDIEKRTRMPIQLKIER